ncbi:MAG: putative ATPase [Gammaproteobacteria bacterium]|jgi:putative ATPase
MSDIETIIPLAARMRPQSLDEFVGQQHLLGNDKTLKKSIESGRLHSMVFWGPPGTGKTTLAKIIASTADANFVVLSAVLSGVKDIREAVESARNDREAFNRDTILFVDEVHRFNKAQQDAFLPHIENGTIIFIGATTENPSFELNNALLSRVRVYVLTTLLTVDVVAVLKNAIANESRGLGELGLTIDEDAINSLAEFADGDARRALNVLEILSDLAENKRVTNNLVLEIISGAQNRRFDKHGEVFYDQISALHKSVRGSSPDAALYWFMRMIDAGCDPLYIARRVVRMASEDIGNADPRALRIALDAWDVQERLGSPEGELAIAQAIIYLACAPKSNAVYKAFNEARADVSSNGSLDVPLHLRNAPTQLMKKMDYGKNYRYAHDEPDAYAAGENYFPDGMQPKQYYNPVDRGLEQTIAAKLEKLRQMDKNKN